MVRQNIHGPVQFVCRHGTGCVTHTSHIEVDENQGFEFF
jgi:hypothetical protein